MSPDPVSTVELRLRAAVESSPSGLLMVDAEGRIVLVNRQVERLFGYPREELLGRPVDMLVPERFRARHAGYRAGFLAEPRVRAMGAGRDLYGLRKDGTEVPVEIGLTPVATDEGVFVLGAIVDITARKQAEEVRARLEEQLRQLQKLEAVGTLAGGIAHDFNNILAAIVGYAEMLEGHLAGEQAERDLGELLTMTERGRQLVHRILTFSRRQDTARRPLALEQVVSEGAKMLRATLPAGIEMRVHTAGEMPRVLADTTSVQQVLMNLATNAAHAMRGGGVLEIDLASTYVRDSLARANPDLHEGPYVVLQVRDNGTGMESAVLERAFEPFFTTKPAGAGSGLGLAMAHGIMHDHGGSIQLESAMGEGTTARCFFPALLAGEREALGTLGHAARGGGERVLFVDDEPMLADVGQRRLISLGFAATAVVDSRQALALVKEAPAAFDAVITDLSMPWLDGLHLARELHALRPDLPILLLTGLVDDLPVETVRAAGVSAVLKKPVSGDELARALTDLIHPSRSPAS